MRYKISINEKILKDAITCSDCSYSTFEDVMQEISLAMNIGYIDTGQEVLVLAYQEGSEVNQPPTNIWFNTDDSIKGYSNE